MTATTQQEQTALTLPERAAVALGESGNEAKLRELAAQSAGIVTISNPDGREEAHRAVMVLRTTRTTITNTGKAAREDATAFSKAVIAKEKELIAIIEPEEQRVLALRDAFDEKVAAEKAARIAEERARTERIEEDIENLRAIPSLLIGKSVPDLQFALKDMQSMVVEESRFAEYLDQAGKVVAGVVLAIEEQLASAVERERIAAEAEAARIVEAERIAAEKVAIAAERAENARQAAEVAAERQRLAKVAAAQMEAAQAAQKLADDQAKAERDRIAAAAAEAQAKLDAQTAALAEQSRKLVEQQAAADARDAAAQAEREREAAHPEALMMNAEFDVARDAERERVAAELAAQAPAPVDTSIGALADVLSEEDSLTDAEIIDMVMDVFNFHRADAIDRLQAINFDAARAAA